MAYSSADKFMMSAGAGGIGAGLGSLFFGGGENPYDSASKYLNQIPGSTQQYYQPYMDAGKNALNTATGQYNNLINDPNGMLNKFGAGYQKSPGFDWQMNQGMNAANNAAASGGMLGSPQHQQQATQMAEGIANQDYQNYLNHVLGLYGQGLAGNQNINQMGFNANDQYSRIIADMLSQQGQMAFAGQASQNQSQGQGWGNLIGGAAQFLPYLI